MSSISLDSDLYILFCTPIIFIRVETVARVRHTKAAILVFEWPQPLEIYMNMAQTSAVFPSRFLERMSYICAI
jgi:hypothetical protein